ncbi:MULTISPECIES: hypothetical protein [Nitrospirillum]|uniref:Uncharacterized protein n=1 Tax=Nitrospirillum amazonense TaxID=28077 RepID=A0A560FH74_9PROT|nr:hypothetical protein [Nitrospirillum amazonense]MEC4589828.1 hypothetical protein [Nitrospirillum amazonense]TWB20960.1 hypothetical protein FBZ88_12046 [Nitrospirillum amazonense]
MTTPLRLAAALATLLLAPPALATDAAALAGASPLTREALARLRADVDAVRNPVIKAATEDALFNPATCVAHRANLGQADKRAIIDRLVAESLADPGDGLADGLFPALPGEGGPCPHLPQPFAAAPGGNAGSHHSWPGGLPLHEAFNAQSAKDFAAAYRAIDGVVLDGQDDLIAAAPLWHDWAKALLFVWRPDGGLPSEVSLGGHGADGDYRTGAHHILGLAEAMARRLPADLVIVQACAHQAPERGKPDRLVHWLRAAAIIAQVDPVAAGYLALTSTGVLTLPGMTESGAVPRWWSACLIHAQSDHNWVYAEPAVEDADALLRQLAPRFGVDADDPARYTWGYRHAVLSRLGAARVQSLAAQGGLDALAQALTQLRAQGVF